MGDVADVIAMDASEYGFGDLDMLESMDISNTEWFDIIEEVKSGTGKLLGDDIVFYAVDFLANELGIDTDDFEVYPNGMATRVTINETEGIADKYEESVLVDFDKRLGDVGSNVADILDARKK